MGWPACLCGQLACGLRYIAIDFKLFPKDAYGYNAAFIVIDRLYKQSVSLPYFKTTTIKDIARLYVNNIYRIYGAPELIISDYSPQFILDF